jgi:uncharacterized membrane-anchored protein
MIESAFMTRRLGVLVALCALAATASADKPKAKKAPPPKAEKAPAPAADEQPADPGAEDGSAEDGSAALPPGWTLGPTLIDLGNDTEVDVPAGLAFVDRETTKAELEKGGDSGENVEGMIVSPDGWEVVIEYNGDGHVNDSDANELDPNDLFKSYQEGNTQQNTRRRSLGVPELFLDGWSDMPHYEKASHHLLWGLKGHSTDGQVVNYFTRILGRTGYMSLDLIASSDTIEQAKTQAAEVITATRFKAGSKYEDYKAGDKSSGMGLKALVIGGAGVAVFKVAKAGILIKLLLIFKKGFIVLIAGIGALFKKIFGRGGSKTQLPPDGPPVG